MPRGFVTPKAASVADMLGMLYGDDVDTSDCAAMPDPAGSYGAEFVDDDGELVAICVCDKQFVGYSGAGLSMLPKGGAEDMIADNDFSKTVLDNFYEVMNICSRLLMSDTSPHLRLTKSFGPDKCAAAIGELGEAIKVGYEVAIPKYGKGKCFFLHK